MLIKEYRVLLPFTLDEYKRGQLYCTAQMSKENTGGGEGIEVLKNEEFSTSPNPPLLDNISKGQYTHKIYHLKDRVPTIVRMIAPKGSLELEEEAWNSYPYCRTVVTNPKYMKENFIIKIETMHVQDNGTNQNAHKLPADLLAKREVVYIDIVNDRIAPKDYIKEDDPSLYNSKKTGRGPLRGQRWSSNIEPMMCAYKLVTVEFKWFGLQTKVEGFLQNFERRLFTLFHRKVFCQLDNWVDLSMDDIRALEDEAKTELDKLREKGEKQGLGTE